MVQAVKRGFRALSPPKTCGIRFERCPVWLWTLRPAEWCSTSIAASDERRLHSSYRSTWDRFCDKLAIEEVVADVGTPDVWWISGSERFVAGLDLPDAIPSVTWRSKAWRRTPRASTSEQWYSVSHQNVGGVTNARGLFGLHRFEPMTLARDLPRTLAHVIKYSIRAVPCAPDLGMEPHCKISDRLRVSQPNIPVVYSIHFSRMGWGKRPLEDPDLALAFDLPDFVAWESRFLMEIVPLQLLRAVMDVVLEQLTPSLSNAGKRRKLVDTSIVNPSATRVDRHWLPALNRWLPGSWAEAPIADKAVKADGADINFVPWHERIQLVIPWCQTRQLRTMERACMRRWQGQLTRSLTTYLAATYGKDWVAILLAGRRSTRGLKRL